MTDTQILEFLMGMLTQVKLFHWATMSYAKHVALDKLHGSLSEKVDAFVECYIGRFKRQPLKGITIAPGKANTDTAKLDRFLEATRDAMQGMMDGFEKAPELQNIIQDMMADVDQAIYLCKLS